MKTMTLIFLLTFYLNVNAQNPETGWFWSLRMEKQVLDTITGKFEGMGWSETKTGKYAFEFSENTVMFYIYGFMGIDYEEIKYYSVINRKRIEDKSEYSTYEYNVKEMPNGEDEKFIVQASVNNEKLAMISYYQEAPKDVYTKITSFMCIKKYK